LELLLLTLPELLAGLYWMDLTNSAGDFTPLSGLGDLLVNSGYSIFS
jgi:hypothetical protein